MTFQENTSTILRDYFLMPKDDEEDEKRAIIETATKMSDIKYVIEPAMSEYPKDLKMEATLSIILPGFVSCFSISLSERILGVSSRVYAIIQAVRHQTVIAPLQLEQAV